MPPSAVQQNDRARGNVSTVGLITLSGTLTLDLATYNQNTLVIDPGGAGRTVLLWPEADVEGCEFLFKNQADAAEALTIKDDSNTTTVAIVPRGHTAHVACIDATWALVGVVPTTDATDVAVDVIAEKTTAAGVTVDGCLIKDGRAAALATAAMFSSTEVTGNGSAQNTAHGLGATPTMVWATVTEDGGTGFDVAPGSHDATNCVYTVTNGVKYRVYAIK